MAKQYILRFTIDGYSEDRIWEVRENDVERLSEKLNSLSDNILKNSCYFWFDSVNGESIIINLEYVLVVRYLWEVSELPSDLVRSDASTSIFFVGREIPLVLENVEPISLFSLFHGLQNDLAIDSYPTLEDEDGELLQINGKQVLYVVAPKHLIAGGEQQLIEEDNLHDDF